MGSSPCPLSQPLCLRTIASFEDEASVGLIPLESTRRARLIFQERAGSRDPTRVYSHGGRDFFVAFLSTSGASRGTIERSLGQGIDFVYTYRFARSFDCFTNFIIISPQATLSAIMYAVLSTAHILIVITLSRRAFHSLSTKTHNSNRGDCSRQPTSANSTQTRVLTSSWSQCAKVTRQLLLYHCHGLLLHQDCLEILWNSPPQLQTCRRADVQMCRRTYTHPPCQERKTRLNPRSPRWMNKLKCAMAILRTFHIHGVGPGT